MSAIFFALTSFIGWGISDLFVTISARKLNAYSATFWSILISVLCLSFYAPFAWKSLEQLTLNIFILNIFLGAVLMGGIIAYREGLIGGSSPIVVTIGASFNVVTTILSIIFFKERLIMYQVLAIVIIFIGIILSTLDLGKMTKRKLQIDKSLIFALIAMFLWGIYFTFIKIPVSQIGWFWPNYFSFLFFAPFVFLFLKMRKITLYGPTHNKAFLPLFLSVVLARGAELSFNLGIERGYTSIVAPIAGSNSILFVILAALTLKDPVTRQ
ncbi:EamA family transporter [Candidatus Daviesbacteria bacterium]|nr:EamA family transporter [Candidatus Daviesbacteria bacterium]